MSLLSDFFDGDNYELISLNKKYIIVILLMIFIMILLILIKKDIYYQNSFNVIENNVVLLVEKNYVNIVKENKKIIINDIKYDYKINTIEQVNNNFLINIKLDTELININYGSYKIFLGKERLFDYIIKIIKWKK